MLSYHTLDMIADSINPLLGVVALVLPWIRRGRPTRQALALDGLTGAAVLIAYLLQAVDSALGMWPRAGLDFSTHTAVFVGIASSIWQHGRFWRWAIAGLGFAYATLMRIQEYHSVLDIVSTVAATLPLLVLLWWRAARSLRLEALA